MIKYKSDGGYFMGDGRYVYMVVNEKDRDRPFTDLIGSDVMINGEVYRVENVEAYAIWHIKKGKYIGLLVTKQKTNDGN